MKILVIFTGGTIGSSTASDGYTSPDQKNNFVLINNYTSKFGNDTEFDTLSPFSMLSENLSHTELNGITETVGANIGNGYDGIILTHGTDSLQYTAAALSYCFPSINIPVILVSSRYPLIHPEQNGDDNFAAAVSFIKEKAGKGVFVSYRNNGCESTHIHYGTRVFSHLEITDSVYSIGDMFYASHLDGRIMLNKAFKFSDADTENKIRKFCPNSGILVVNSVPGDAFDYSLDDKKAVLLRPYHSGTVNTESSSFRAFCKRAKEKTIPVFVPGAGIETAYASTAIFNELNIKHLPCMTFVSAYIKLWLAVSEEADINEFMYKPIANEILI